MYRSEARAIAQSWSAPNVDINFTEPLNNAAESVAEAVVPEVVNQSTSDIVRNVVAPTTSTATKVAGATSAFIATAYNVYKNPEILSNIKVLLSAPKKAKKKSKKKSKFPENKLDDATLPTPTPIFNTNFKLSESEVKELNPFIDGFNDDKKEEKSTENDDLPPPLEEMKEENDDTEPNNEYLNLTETVSKEDYYDESNSNVWNEEQGESLFLDALENTKLKNYKMASEQVDHAIQAGIKNNKMKAGALRLRGTYLYLANSMEAAIADFEESLKLDPENIQTHIKLASCLLEKGELEPSLELFDRAAMISSDDPDLYYHRAHIKFMLNQYEDSIEDYKKSAELDPSFVFCYIQQGVAYYRNGSTPTAIKTFEDASKKFPNSPDLHNYYGEILMDLQRFDDAMNEFDKASKVAPQLPFSYVNKAILYQQKMDLLNSEKFVRKAIEVDPECDIAHVHLAQICLQKHDIAEAVEEYGKAIEVARTNMDLQQAVMCREAAKAQLDVIKKYPDIKEKFFK
ncbi:hypothetical protein PIROE2DRAFT_59575 [Piromyces sp. E2]|nr:hypothetical protein PIROE2DRAFT_59575 [Piromyces sp. E2]|eukprot:OUM66123.1 hypothetical protein PIROE2DRAFT_59575 [Piromyces sp. E2]